VHTVSATKIETETQVSPLAAQGEKRPLHSVWKTSIRYALLTALLFGVGYPVLMTLIAGAIFPRRAAGSLILRNGQTVGSALLAQSFTSDRYFHPRPSATDYSATADFAANSTTSPSGGSNLAQSNAKLAQRIQADIDKLQAQNPGKPVPIDLVTTSGSGLDPDITPDDAYYQAPRVAKARGLSQDALRKLIAQHTETRQLGFLGEPRVNVLELNLALDAMAK